MLLECCKDEAEHQMLDEYHWINDTGCLDVEDIQAIAREVWESWKEIDMATIKTIMVDSPEKMPNQNSVYSIIIPQVRDTVPLSEQETDKRESHSDVKPKE